MWFKNLALYRYKETPDWLPDELEAKLTSRRFKPCGGLDFSSSGWESPLGPDGQLLVHVAAGRVMVCMRREDRVLPGAVVREVLDERVRELEAAEQRKLGRKQRQQLKDEIVVDLLPRAFRRSARLYAYLDPTNGWVAVDTASPKRAEELLTMLRQSLGSLPVEPLQVQIAPATVMTGWLQRRAPKGLTIEDECELREPLENGGIVRCRRQVLDGEEVGTHLEAGKQVVRLAVTWRERLSCLVCDDLVIRRLRFAEVIQKDAGTGETEDLAARMDADFALMALELQPFLEEFVDYFGGFRE
jgi:recombination associated protein RdgC